MKWAPGESQNSTPQKDIIPGQFEKSDGQPVSVMLDVDCWTVSDFAQAKNARAVDKRSKAKVNTRSPRARETLTPAPILRKDKSILKWKRDAGFHLDGIIHLIYVIYQSILTANRTNF